MTRIRNIRDLAKVAGVSTGTVSRALAGSPLVNRETRERVRALAAAHDFRPNPMARNLRMRRTGAIGVVVPAWFKAGTSGAKPFMLTMLAMLADLLNQRGMAMRLLRGNPEQPGWLDEHADGGTVDGLVILGMPEQFDAIETLAQRYHPLVAWGSAAAGQQHCSVGVDSRMGGALATQHLIERGCTRIALLVEDEGLAGAELLAGCRAMMARAGLGENPMLFATTTLPAKMTRPLDHAFAPGFQGRPDGLLASSDIAATVALRVLSDANLKAPHDLRVVGYGATGLSDSSIPRMSTVNENLELGADHMVDLLMRRIDGEQTASVVMEPRLEVRDSS